MFLRGKARKKNTGHHSNQVLILPNIGTKWLFQTCAQTMPTIKYIYTEEVEKRWTDLMSEVQIKQRFILNA